MQGCGALSVARFPLQNYILDIFTSDPSRNGWNETVIVCITLIYIMLQSVVIDNMSQALRVNQSIFESIYME